MKVGIAGAGLLGRLLGWQLQRRGHQVTLFDAGDELGTDSAAYVAAAMLAPYSEAVTSGAELFSVGRQAVSQWQRLLQQLAENSAQKVALNEGGSVVIAHDLDRANLQHFAQKLRAAVGDDNSVKTLDRTGLSELEPELPSRFNQGLWLAGEGCLDNRGLLSALHDALQSGGAELRWHCPASRVDAGIVHTPSSAETFDWAIDCRGLGAKTDWPDVRGVRGEILWVRAPEVRLNRPVRLMHPRYHLYITPKPGDIYVVGATEIESESRAPVTVRSQLELLSALYSVHSGFAEAQIVGSYARCRPSLPDNLPQVQASDGLLRLNGLYRHGYLLAPTVVESAVRALDGDFSGDFVKNLVAVPS